MFTKQPMNTPVHLDDLMSALDWVSAGNSAAMECAAFISRETGEIFWTGEGIDEALPDDFEDGTAYEAVPDKGELELGRSLALQFVGMHLPLEWETVARFFRQRGAYAKFKTLLERSGQLDNWHGFERRGIEEALVAWCEAHGFDCSRARKTNGVQIRPAVVADASTLAKLAARTFEETFGADNTPEDLKAHLASAYGTAQQAAELADPHERTLLAYQDGELIGFAQVRRKAFPSCVVAERPVELHRFYLLRSAHGAGAAMPLMQKARDAAMELGGTHMWLGVWERNPRAVAFYRKSGFVKVGAHEFVVGSDVQTDWVFLAPLQGAEFANP
jgi:diamine N-acetyltransferase